MRKPVKIVLLLLLSGSFGLASCTSEPSHPDLSLIGATARGDTKAVKTLLAAGADVHAKDKDGLTALMHAAISRHTAIVHALLDAGADVNAKSAAGTTALTFAGRRGYTNIVRILKEAGARK